MGTSLSRLQLAQRIHLLLLREIDHAIEVERLLADPRYARDVLLVCEAVPGGELQPLVRLFRDTSQPATGPAPTAQQVASASIPPATTPAQVRPALTATRRLWIQLASGANATELPGEFAKIKRRNRDLFEGISGYIAEEPGRARLLIGPFRNSEEAGIFAEDLASVRVDAFTWTNQPGQAIRKLPTE